MSEGFCRSCGGSIPRWRKYCVECCYQTAVYRFICPDGRSYVGSTHDLRTRAVNGLLRSNRRIKAVIEKYPPETWRFEVLERLPSRRPFREALEAEQRHIDRLGTLNTERGFNVYAAVAPPQKEEAAQQSHDGRPGVRIRTPSVSAGRPVGLGTGLSGN